MLSFSSVAEAYRPDPPSPAGVNFFLTVDSKFKAILEKLEEFKAENDVKLGQILTQTSDLQTKVS